MRLRAHAVLHRSGRARLRVGHEREHGSLREIFPRDAHARRLSAAVTVRGVVPVGARIPPRTSTRRSRGSAGDEGRKSPKSEVLKSRITDFRLPLALQRFSRACSASFWITLTSSATRALERRPRHACWRRTAVPLGAPVRRVARPARRPGLTRAASVGVRRSPVSRLFRGGVRRSLIAYSSPTPLWDRRRTGLGAITITRLTGRRRSERPSAAEAIARCSRWRPVSRGGALRRAGHASARKSPPEASAAPATSTRTAIGKPGR